MRYLSVCSGIEAATVAWHPLGWTPAAFAEIEPFPRAVLAHRFPHVPIHGDFTTIKGDEYGPIDLLVGGTPCQSFSVAGLRSGLADDRGNLALEFLRLAKRTRARWLVWENVPGVLSSNGGRDFGSILGGLVELGYGFAYRVLDAQFFGVPQRRRRVFVVGYLGDWRRAAAVLFERHSLSGNSPPRRETGQAVAGSLTARASGGGGGPGAGTDEACAGYLQVAHTVMMHGSASGRYDASNKTFVAHAVPAIAFAQNTRDEVRMQGGDGQIVGALAAQPGMKQTTYVAFSVKDHGADAGAVSPTLRSGGAYGANGGVMPAMAFSVCPDHCGGDKSGQDVAFVTEISVSRTLDCTGADINRKQGGVGIASGTAVRRLTPRECERLQGFPDDWTLVPYRNKPAADGPRYKALGNSMAVPCMRWIGERIAMVEALGAVKESAAA